MSSIAIHKAKLAASLERDKCVRDLHYLSTEYLGIRVLDAPFNRECLKFMDENVHHNRALLMAPRHSYKTLSVKARMIQEILRCPNVTVGYVHHSLDKAEQIVNEVAEILAKNEKLQGILPRGLPKAGKWYMNGSILLPGRETLGHKQPTIRAFSTGQDLTGQHFSLLIGDDLISKKTMEEMGGVEGVDRWWTSTAVPVIGSTGRALLVGTRWTYDDLYAEAMVSPIWNVMHRGILEDETQHPDAKGLPIQMTILEDPDDHNSELLPLTMERVIAYQLEMKGDFAAQMLNLPEPEGGRAWLAGTHEHHVSLESIQDHIRQVIILVDPAPKGANMNHDFWANAVVGYYEMPKSPGVLHRVLLDGNMSQDWTTDDGMTDVLRLLRKWSNFGACLVGVEEGLGAARNAMFYCNRLRDTCRGRHRVQALPFKLTQQKDSKNRRFADLASLAGAGWFTIADSCNKQFVQLFQYQCRSHPDQYDGHDDLRDAVSYMNDSILDEHIPKAHIPARRRLLGQWDPLGHTNNGADEKYQQRSRYFNL